MLRLVGTDEQHCSDQCDRRDHEVHIQAPAPVGPLGEHATQQESQGTATTSDGTEDAEGLTAFGRIGERRGEQGQRGGRQ